MTVIGWLRGLDDDALAGRLRSRLAHPDCTAWQLWWALGGIGYGIGIGSWLLVSLVTFDRLDLLSLLLGLVLGLPWPAIPLVWTLRVGRPRTGGVLTAVLAAAHFVLLAGSWGMELVYLPLVLVGLVVAFAPARADG